jgi:hypothetical protein
MMSQKAVKIFLDAADRASLFLLSVVGAFALIANLAAWAKGQDIVIPSQSYPSVAVFLLAWLALVAVYSFEAKRGSSTSSVGTESANSDDT